MSSQSNPLAGEAALSPEVEKAIANVVRFRDIRPAWTTGAGENARQIALYKYTDKVQSDFVKGAAAAVDSEELRLTTGVLGPGEGAPLHDHTTEELMFVAAGSWVVYFDEAEQQKVYLEPWDAILVPANLPRGWRNVGHEIGCFLNISNVRDKMMPVSSSSSSTTTAAACESS